MRSLAPSVATTRPVEKRESLTPFASSSEIANTSEFSPGLKSSTLAWSCRAFGAVESTL